jgi:hypothetical protein
MNNTKPQRVNPSQVKQFMADARKRALAAKKNLAIDDETAYHIVCAVNATKPSMTLLS